MFDLLFFSKFRFVFSYSIFTKILIFEVNLVKEIIR